MDWAIQNTGHGMLVLCLPVQVLAHLLTWESDIVNLSYACICKSKLLLKPISLASELSGKKCKGPGRACTIVTIGRYCSF